MLGEQPFGGGENVRSFGGLKNFNYSVDITPRQKAENAISYF